MFEKYPLKLSHRILELVYELCHLNRKYGHLEVIYTEVTRLFDALTSEDEKNKIVVCEILRVFFNELSPEEAKHLLCKHHEVTTA